MSGYSAHSTLTPARLAVLVQVARGERPEIQRIRLRWFVQHGWMVRGGQPAQHTLTDKAWDRVIEATGMDRRAFVMAHRASAGYVAERRRR